MLNIPSQMNRYGDGLESADIEVTGLVGTHFRYCHLGIVPEGREGRQVFQGPMVPGPWGYTVTHALVIDTRGGSAAEHAGCLKVAVGDEFTVDGLPGVWTFRSPNPRRYEGDGAQLERVS